MSDVDLIINFHMQLAAVECCDDFNCPACGGGGKVYPVRHDPAFMGTVLSDVVILAEDMGPASGREMYKLMRGARRYIMECQRENFREAFEKCDLEAYANLLENNAQTMPPEQKEAALILVKALRTCDGTYESFLQKKRELGVE